MRARTTAGAILGICASVFIVAPFGAWAATALWFRLPAPGLVKAAAAGFAIAVAFATVVALFTRARWRALSVFALAFAALALWWSAIRPPSAGDWAPEVARQTTGKVDGDILTLSDVRDFDWRSDKRVHRTVGAPLLRSRQAQVARPLPLLLGGTGDGPSHHELRL